MNSEKKPKNIKALLDSTTLGISPAVAGSLHAFRTSALKQQRLQRSPLVNWIYAHTGLPVSNPLTRPASMLLASVFLAVTLLASYNFVQNYLNDGDTADVDLAILTDDMPLHVYVD